MPFLQKMVERLMSYRLISSHTLFAFWMHRRTWAAKRWPSLSSLGGNRGARQTTFGMEIYRESPHNEDMETPTDPNEWEFFDYDGAVFRRPKGNIGGVTHVFNEKVCTWRPYGGADKIKPSLFGDRINAPPKSFG
jgi:hypothetical protein